MSTDQHFHNLYNRFFDKTATASEKQELLSLLRSSTYDEELKAAIDRTWGQMPKIAQADVDAKAILDTIYQSAAIKPQRSTHRVHFLRRGWFKYAAAIILTIGLGTVAYLLTTKRNQEQTLTSDNKRLQTDIPPGGEKAILTLADGTKILLDEAGNGQLANQGGVAVVKLSNGQIAYEISAFAEASADEVWNTMSTPVGGQYQVTLPDGTKVWLNAASSITYPAAFIGSERKIKVAGEVYLEVARNKAKPFKVDVDGKTLVEVLGTSFNINSYSDDANIKTTLIDGSVKVTKGNKNVVLKPGQQVQIKNTSAIAASSDRELEVVNANLSQTLAWKNGIFDFTGADLRSIMRQLERWYDIKVVYKGPVSNEIFEGEMYRNVNLSNVLRFLKASGLKFRMDGKTLVVL